MPRFSTFALIAICSLHSGCGDEAAQVETTARIAIGDANRGRVLIRRYECGACHVVPGVSGARNRVGPSLERFALKPYVAGKFPNTSAMLVAWIMNPPSLSTATAMPAIGVTAEDARDIAAYLYTLN